MKIIQLTTFYAPIVGGVETQVEDLSLQLKAEGHTVSILTTDSARNNKRLGRKSDNDLISDLPVSRVRTWFSFTAYHKFAPGIFSKLLKVEFDIVHVHGIRKPEVYLAMLAAKLQRKKIVVSTHNPFTTVGRSGKMKLFIALHDILLGITLMRFVDHWFVLSKNEIAILARFGVSKKKITVVANAVSDEFFEEKELEQTEKTLMLNEITSQAGIKPTNWDMVVLGVGRVNMVKGFQNLLQATKSMPKTLFIIVGGDDGYLDKLRNIFRNCNNVALTATFYPREKLIEFYSLADVFVLPSLHEPFGIVLLEAMAKGNAVIATDVGGPKEIIVAGESGLLLSPTDQNAWAAELKRLSKDRSELLRLQKSAQEAALTYSWKKILPKYLRVYKSV